jgi:hypothetical protein
MTNRVAFLLTGAAAVVTDLLAGATATHTFLRTAAAARSTDGHRSSPVPNNGTVDDQSIGQMQTGFKRTVFNSDTIREYFILKGIHTLYR